MKKKRDQEHPFRTSEAGPRPVMARTCLDDLRDDLRDELRDLRHDVRLMHDAQRIAWQRLWWVAIWLSIGIIGAPAWIKMIWMGN